MRFKVESLTGMIGIQDSCGCKLTVDELEIEDETSRCSSKVIVLAERRCQ